MVLIQESVTRIIPPLDESPDMLTVRGFDFVPAQIRAIGPALDSLRHHPSEVAERVVMDVALHGLEVAMKINSSVRENTMTALARIGFGGLRS